MYKTLQQFDNKLYTTLQNNCTNTTQKLYTFTTVNNTVQRFTAHYNPLEFYTTCPNKNRQNSTQLLTNLRNGTTFFFSQLDKQKTYKT